MPRVIILSFLFIYYSFSLLAQVSFQEPFILQFFSNTLQFDREIKGYEINPLTMVNTSPGGGEFISTQNIPHACLAAKRVRVGRERGHPDVTRRDGSACPPTNVGGDSALPRQVGEKKDTAAVRPQSFIELCTTDRGQNSKNSPQDTCQNNKKPSLTNTKFPESTSQFSKAELSAESLLSPQGVESMAQGTPTLSGQEAELPVELPSSPQEEKTIHDKLNESLGSLRQKLIEIKEVKKTFAIYKEELEEAKKEAQKIMLKQLLEKGKDAYQKEDYIQAEEFFNKVLILDFRNRTANRYLSLIKTPRESLKIKKVEIDNKVFKKVMDREIDTHLKRALRFLQKKNFAAAEEEFTKTLQLSSENTDAKEGLKIVRTALQEQKEKSESKETIDKKFKILLELLEKEDYVEVKKKLLELLQEVGKQKNDIEARAVFKEAKDRIKQTSEEVCSSLLDTQFKGIEEKLLDILEEVDTMAKEKQKEEDKRKLESQLTTYIESALACLDNEDYILAKKELSKVLAVEPDNAQALALMEKLNEAIEIIEQSQ